MRYDHVHEKGIGKGEANGRVYVGDEPIRISASFIGLCPRESILIDTIARPLWPSLSHRGYRQQGWQNDNQQQTPRQRLHAFPPDLLLVSGFPVRRRATRAARGLSLAPEHSNKHRSACDPDNAPPYHALIFHSPL